MTDDNTNNMCSFYQRFINMLNASFEKKKKNEKQNKNYGIYHLDYSTVYE